MVINGDLNLKNSSIESLGKLKKINAGGLLIEFNNCKNLKDLGNLEQIDCGMFEIINCHNLKDLGKLKKIKAVIIEFKKNVI